MTPSHLSVTPLLANEVIEGGPWSAEVSLQARVEHVSWHNAFAGISICALNQTRGLTQLGANLTEINSEHREGLSLLQLSLQLPEFQ